MAAIAELTRDEAVKALVGRGWDTKAGQWWAPTTKGGTVALWPTETLTGDVPDDREVKAHYRIVRATIQPSYKAAFDRWLDNALRAKSSDVGFAYLTVDEKKALAEGMDTSGGFAVPAELAADIVSVVRERSIVRQSAVVLPTSRDNLAVPVFDYQAEWVSEVMSSDDTSLPVASLNIRVQKARAKVGVSNDLLADQPALLAWLTHTGSSQLALLEDRTFIAGTASGQQSGLISAGKTFDVTGSTAHTISNTTAALGSATKIISMDCDLPDAFRARSRWITLGATLAEIQQLVDAQSRFLFPSHSENGEEMLRSHPVSTSSAMPADGVAGARCLALVDLTQFVIATRNLLTVRVDTETYGDVDKTLIYLYDRVGGQLAFSDAARIGTVT